MVPQMIPPPILIFVVYGCICTSYVSRQCRSEGTTPQSLTRPAAALPFTLGSSSAACQNVLHFLSPGLSLSPAGRALKASGSRHLSQNCIYRKAAAPSDWQSPELCGAHGTHVERNRQSGIDGNARSRTEAWLNGGQPRARCSWNISSIACWIPNSVKHTNCWRPTSGGPHANCRR